MSGRVKSFRGDFNLLYGFLARGENFAFSRFSDGELFILQNKKLILDRNLTVVGNSSGGNNYKFEDFKSFIPDEHGNFQAHLVETFKHRQSNYFKGVSCACCVGREAFNWQINLHGGDDDSLTWANLWVNGNYARFIEFVLPIFSSKRCVFVGHRNANLSNFNFFVKDFRVGYNAMINDVHVIDEMKEWVVNNSIENHVFLLSASSFSNLAIYELFKIFPNNTFIDIGTTLAKFMNMPMERAYLQAYWNGLNHSDLEKMCIW
jgi:hypothetical protein